MSRQNEMGTIMLTMAEEELVHSANRKLGLERAFNNERADAADAGAGGADGKAGGNGRGAKQRSMPVASAEDIARQGTVLSLWGILTLEMWKSVEASRGSTAPRAAALTCLADDARTVPSASSHAEIAARLARRALSAAARMPAVMTLAALPL